MWPIIANLIGGPLIKGAIDAYKARLQAGQDHEKLAADLTARSLEIDMREREIDAKVLTAEQGNWVTRSVRPLFALPFILFTFKVVVWDKVLGFGHTDPLDANMWSVYMSVVVAYFGGRSAEKVATTIAGAFKR